MNTGTVLKPGGIITLRLLNVSREAFNLKYLKWTHQFLYLFLPIKFEMGSSTLKIDCSIM